MAHRTTTIVIGALAIALVVASVPVAEIGAGHLYGSSPTDAREAVFVCHKGAFDHKLTTWDLVFVNDVRF